jgi:hypothetical protein
LTRSLDSVAKAVKSGIIMYVLMLPWLAFSHILTFTEITKRITRQGHRVTLLSTPRASSTSF